MSGSRVDMKIVLLGKEFGGKTSLVERFLHDRFHGEAPYQATIGAAFGAKRIEVVGKSLILGIWDTAGSERYEAMSRIYYRGAKAAIVCYDMTDSESFARVCFWVKELRNNEENCKIYLCGTKKDLVDENKNNRKVDYHMVTDYADEIRAKVFETSAKTGENIRNLFLKIAEDYTMDPVNKQQQEKDTLNLQEPTKKKRCC
ncbi:ras-related protein Rab-24 [Lingula anatina]|uniref:Ras-related protein Rab-24 n=1 Tax=Lingula anatina TaxID=7574 RepID=A0A1S3IJZ8_LINAN|nr:ras-related protein Rab-24 [Lingula anatina]|eukprot:XP_013397844.1 ras-related protein Rab-24 [Lingula anatina]